jgi:uncharacterized protein
VSLTDSHRPTYPPARSVEHRAPPSRPLPAASWSRRRFLRAATAAALGVAASDRLARLSWGGAGEAGGARGLGPLLPDPERLFDLPRGFSYQVVSRAGDTMSDGLRVPGLPDGMAAFAARDGRIALVRNHELTQAPAALGPFGPDNELLAKLAPDLVYDRGVDALPCLGGTTTLVYDPGAGRVEKQFLSLAGTVRNCAGGATPWGTWVSCEEPEDLVDVASFGRAHGFNFEVAGGDSPPAPPAPLRAMGRFRHEAIAVEPRSGAVYQTEDRPDGLFYRFLPTTAGRLGAGGRLQALVVRDQPSLDTRNWDSPRVAPRMRLAVSWIDLDDVEAPRDDLRARGFERGAARFARGEGAAIGSEGVFFDATNGGRNKAGQIWRYLPSPAEGRPEESSDPGRLELFLEPGDTRVMDYPDNLAVAPWGDLIVCEDGDGDQFLLGVTGDGEVYRLGRNAANDTELAGATFSPDGRVLFLNLYGLGLTLAIRGPWPARAA